MIHPHEIQADSTRAAFRVTISVGAVLALTAWFAFMGQFAPLLACVVLLALASLGFPVLVVPLLLVVGTAVMPFVGNLGGEEQAYNSRFVAFGLTDLLLFAALPGALRLFVSQRQQILEALPRAARNYCLWSLLFLIGCTVSFIVNWHTMTNGVVAYAAGWFRTFQMVVLIPFMFAVVEWKPRDFVGLWTGYVCSVLFFAFMVIGFYVVGAGTSAVFGVHKNVVGLLVASGVIVALISLWSATQKERLLPRVVAETMLIFGMPALAASSSRVSFICFLVGLLMVSVRYRRVKVPVLLMVALAISMWVGFWVTPKWARGLTTSFSPNNPSVSIRFEQFQTSMERFKANPLLGDGLRARKDIQPHNLEVLLLSETGIFGLVTFGGVLAAGFALFRHAIRTLPEKPIFSPTLWALAACCTLVFVHAHSDPFWRRGPALFMGASVGICCAVLRQKSDTLPASEA